MLNQILNVKKTQSLSKKDQKQILGGAPPPCCIDWDPLTRQCHRYDPDCLGN